MAVSFAPTTETFKHIQFHVIGAKSLVSKNIVENLDYYVVIKIEDGQNVYKLRSDKAKASEGIEWFQNIGRLSLKPTAKITFELRSSSMLHRQKLIATTESSPFERLITMQKGRLDDRTFVLSLSLQESAISTSDSSPAVWGTLQLNIRKIVVDTPKEAKEYQAKRRASIISNPGSITPPFSPPTNWGGRDSLSSESEEMPPTPRDSSAALTILVSPPESQQKPAMSMLEQSFEIQEVLRV